MVKNDKTLFSKLTQKISQLTRGKEARRQASKWISPLRQILFILLVSYFNDVCCTFHLGKMFIRFLSIIFHIYCSLVPQLSCITVRLSGGHVSFICCQRLVSVKNKLLQCFMETSQFIFQFAQCARRLWLSRTSLLGKTGLGVRWLA